MLSTTPDTFAKHKCKCLSSKPRVRDFAAFRLSAARGLQDRLPRDLIDVIAHFLLGVPTMSQNPFPRILSVRSANDCIVIEDGLQPDLFPGRHSPHDRVAHLRGGPHALAFVLASPFSQNNLHLLFSGEYTPELHSPPCRPSDVLCRNLTLDEYSTRRVMFQDVSRLHYFYVVLLTLDPNFHQVVMFDYHLFETCLGAAMF